MNEAIAQPAITSARLPQQASPSRSTRRTLQILLGLVWLLDAALQFQPFMFSRAFVTQIIEPVAAGNPAVVAAPILWSAHIMAQHIVLYNAAFAAIQLAIAIGFFFRPTVRLALAASIVWSVFVWWFGEGLGGILTGASPLTGLPGAVILYAFIALLVWPAAEDAGGDGSRLAPALRGPLGRLVPRLCWLLLWAKFAWYLLMSGNRTPNGISGVFTAAAAGQPGWLRSMETGLASLTAQHGLAISVVLAAACGLAGLGIFVPPLTRTALVLAALLGLAFWVAEGFGGIATGTATDPNSGPLLILLAACFWPPAGPAWPAGAGTGGDTVPR
jgi:hypothetical protein